MSNIYIPHDNNHDRLAEQMTQLNDHQLSDLIAAVDATEIVSKAKTISMQTAAQWYATTHNWPVFPLKPRGKKPLTTHGFKDASIDPEQISRWWTQWPDANIGIPTGSTEQNGCGHDVIDIDGQPGIAAWTIIKHQQCPPGCCDITFCPATGPFNIQAMSFTPGDGGQRAPGRHLWIPATGKGNAAGLTEGIDYRGNSGYVVAPPSVGLSGARYTWLSWPAAAEAAS